MASLPSDSIWFPPDADLGPSEEVFHVEHFVRNSALRHLWTCLMSPGLFQEERSVDLVPKAGSRARTLSTRLLSRGLFHVEQSPCDGQRASSGGLTLSPAEFKDPDGEPSGPHVPGRPSEAICESSLDLFHVEHFVFSSTGEVLLDVSRAGTTSSRGLSEP